MLTTQHLVALLPREFLLDKFLVDHEGNPYKRFGPTVDPKAMTDDIETLLKRRETQNPAQQ